MAKRTTTKAKRGLAKRVSACMRKMKHTMPGASIKQRKETCTYIARRSRLKTTKSKWRR